MKFHRNLSVIRPSTIRQHWKIILDKVNVSFVKFHAIRHSYASLLLEKNENPKVIQLLLGHASLTTTMNIYVHATEEQKKNATTKIDYLIDLKRDDNNNNIEEDEIKEQEELYHCS